MRQPADLWYADALDHKIWDSDVRSMWGLQTLLGEKVGESVDRCIMYSRIRGTNAPVGYAERTTDEAVTHYYAVGIPE